MNYPSQAIQLLSKWINGDNKAFNQLNELGYPELGMLNYALSGEKRSLEWLSKSKHVIVYAFAMAIWDDDKKAIKFLLDNKAPLLAATASAIMGDKKARAWLEHNKQNDYLSLVDAIKDKINREAPSDFEGMFKSPIK